MEITKEFKDAVVEALMSQRNNYDGTEASFARQWGINATVYNAMKNGKRDGMLKSSQWLNMGRELQVVPGQRKWVTAKTDVFRVIEEDITFCKDYAKAKICADECGIGKTHTAKYLSRTLKNCFYVDASQAKTKVLFMRLMARTIGVDHTGSYAEIKENIKYYLSFLPKPIVIIDEAGDLDSSALLDLKELWNATENVCGWYLMGADGLRKKIERGIEGKKVGFKELFSRYSERFTSIVPSGKDDKQAFYRKLITQVLTVNMTDTSNLNNIVRKCLTTDGVIGGLRRAESLLILNQ
jgi:DNA transposition AAA+ family ATPase